MSLRPPVNPGRPGRPGKVAKPAPKPSRALASKRQTPWPTHPTAPFLENGNPASRGSDWAANGNGGPFKTPNGQRPAANGNGNGHLANGHLGDGNGNGHDGNGTAHGNGHNGNGHNGNGSGDGHRPAGKKFLSGLGTFPGLSGRAANGNGQSQAGPNGVQRQAPAPAGNGHGGGSPNGTRLLAPAGVAAPARSGFQPAPPEGSREPVESAPTNQGRRERIGRRGKKKSANRLRVPVADGFRGIAAVGVVAVHCLYAAARPHLANKFLLHLIVASYVSVDFFFILSGFLLFLPVMSQGSFGNKRAYALRRGARILPAYYVSVIATLLLTSWIVTLNVRIPIFSRVVGEALFFHLTFAQHSLGLALGLPEGFFVNGVFWTLAIEVVFYALLPFLANWYRRHPFIGLGVAELIAWGWRFIGSHDLLPLPRWAGLKSAPFVKEILVTQFPTYTAHFALGMTAAWVFYEVRRGRFKFPSWAAIPFEIAGLWGVLAWMNAAGAKTLAFKAGALADWTATTPVALAFTVLLLGTALAPKFAQWPFKNWVVSRLGDVSYGLYLTHLIFVGFALKTLQWAPNYTTGDFLRLFAFAGGGSLIVGTISYYFMERPIIRWSHRKSKVWEQRDAAKKSTEGAGGEVPPPHVMLPPVEPVRLPDPVPEPAMVREPAMAGVAELSSVELFDPGAELVGAGVGARPAAAARVAAAPPARPARPAAPRVAPPGATPPAGPPLPPIERLIDPMERWEAVDREVARMERDVPTLGRPDPAVRALAQPPALAPPPAAAPHPVSAPPSVGPPHLIRPVAAALHSSNGAAGARPRPAAKPAERGAPPARSVAVPPKAPPVPEEFEEPGIIFVEDVLGPAAAEELVPAAAAAPVCAAAPVVAPSLGRPIGPKPAAEPARRGASKAYAEVRPSRPSANGNGGGSFWWAGVPTAQSAVAGEPAEEPVPVPSRGRAWAAR